MTTKSFILATLTGAIVLFLLGFLFYGIVFHQDFDNQIITARNVLIDPPRFPFLILGNLIAGAFLTYSHTKINIANSSYAFVIGFLILGFVGLYANVISYGRTDILMLHGVFLDAIILATMGGAASFFIYYILEWTKKA